MNDRLTAELSLLCIGGWIALSAMALWYAQVMTGLVAIQWLIQSGLLWLLVISLAFRRREMNRATPGSRPYLTLGWGNRLTILRGALIAGTGGFLFSEWPSGIWAYVPAVLFTTAVLIDRVDGYLARREGQTSLMGTELDTLYDALGLIVAPLLAVIWGQIHWSYLVVGVAYYLFRAGMYYRTRHGLPVYPLKPMMSRRAWAGIQMGVVAAVLWPVVGPPLTIVASTILMIPLLVGFILDWLTVSGRRQQDDEILAGISASLMYRFAGPILRGAATITICVWILNGYDSPEITISLIALSLFFAAMLLAGFLARLAAALLMIVLALSGDSGGFAIAITLVCSLIIVSGSGNWSLWQGDADWMNRYDGT